MNDSQNSWQTDFQQLSLQDMSRNPGQNDLNFQHPFLDQVEHKNDNIQTAYENPITLRYRDSICSTASSLSRNSTMSSTDTRYFSATQLNSPPLSRAPSSHTYPTVIPMNYNSQNTYNIASPTQMSPISMPSPEMYQQRQSFSQTLMSNTIDPNGCFVPCKPLPLVQKNETTRYHYVVPTFAMIGQNQADVMKILFNITDQKPFEAKEELENTISWKIDQNQSLVTLSQYTGSGLDTPVSRNYLVGLGQRLGITSILLIISIEAINNIDPLLDNLVKALEIDAKSSNLIQNDQPSWWSRVILIVNQQYGVSPQVAYSQRKAFLVNEMPRIQQKYGLSQPLSTLFLSTQIHDQLLFQKDHEKASNYKQCCQRILWQMMQKHTLCGRWCSEIISLQNRMNSLNSTATVNILTEDDESSSSSDEEDGMPKIINYVDYKVVKTDQLLAKKKQPSLLQRRTTRRVVQKLHCYDGDDGTNLPSTVKNY